MPQISVIVPVYKTEKYLDQCVRSILGQSFVDLELILVDDGSPDSCGEMCEHYVEKDSRVKVIHQPNQGLSSARNAGIGIALGKYIGFIDSDDWIHPEMYRLLYQDMEDVGASIAACGIRKVYGGEPFGSLKNSVPIVEAGRSALSDILRCTAPGGHTACNRLYRRELFDDINFPVGRLYEDAFTIPLLYQESKITCYRKNPLYYYRRRAGSIMKRPFDIQSMDKLAAADSLLEFIRQTIPELEREALCFRTVSALRLMTDLLAAGQERFPEDYRRVSDALCWQNIIGRSRLSLRHRLLLALFFISPALYQRIWEKHLS